jgi:Ser/Thr protein kinase RdoA (MazF antagonist)
VISLRQIQEIVRQYPANFQPTHVEPLGAAGGMSGAQFWRIESPSGVLMLRRWPSEHPSPDRLRFIHRVLFHATERGLPYLPTPIRTSMGESFVLYDGYLWELNPWMPGKADYEQSPDHQKLGSAMTALARFHSAVSDFPKLGLQQVAGAPPAISRRLSRLRELSRRGASQFSDTINVDIWPELTPLADRFLAAMPGILSRAIAQLAPLSNIVLPVQPCIRDIWHDHVLFTGDVVTAIIDFGATDIDTPATDVARLLGSLVGDDEAGWRTGVSAYSRIRRLTADEERAAKALDTSSPILAGYNWLRWIHVDGRQFEDHARVVERFQRIVVRCELAATSSPTAPDFTGG